MKDSLYLDLLSYSELDKLSHYRYMYALDPSFSLILLSYAFHDEPTFLIDLTSGQELPESLIEALLDENILKIAYDASFIRINLAKHLGLKIHPRSWYCSKMHAKTLMLDGTEQDICSQLNINHIYWRENHDFVKPILSSSGKCKVSFRGVSIKNQLRRDEWWNFKTYFPFRLDAHRKLYERLRAFPIPDFERDILCLDQEINDRGVLIDVDFVQKADKLVNEHRLKLEEDFCTLTGTRNPRDRSYLRRWFKSHGLQLPDFKGTTLERAYADAAGPVAKALRLMSLLLMISSFRYEKIAKLTASDSKLRGLFTYYGTRTGRWSSKGVQAHNLPKVEVDNPLATRNQAMSDLFLNKIDGFNHPLIALSRLVRTSFIPDRSSKFIIADYSAIEPRILAWICDEKWKLELFSSDMDYYSIAASRLFGMNANDIEISSELRNMAKRTEIALGYGGSVKSLEETFPEMDRRDLMRIVESWKSLNLKTIRFWESISLAVQRTVKTSRTSHVGRIRIAMVEDFLQIQLPSSRSLYLKKPSIEVESGHLKLSYVELHGGKKRVQSANARTITQNIVQAIGRDLLAETMLRLNYHDFSIVMHIHDEVVLEVPSPSIDIASVKTLMEIPPIWAEGLNLKAVCTVNDFYS